jgi:flagellar M-ring protein FliF
MAAGTGNRYFEQISEVWTRLDRSQRRSIVYITLLALGVLGALVFYMNRVEYEVLYRDLSSEDAQAVAAKLKAEKRDYLVDGTSILVGGPKSEVDKLKLEIAGSGLVSSGRVGFEIFDKSQFGMTDFTEQVNLQRALEGELSRTISILAEISSARVHLVLPKESIFEDRKQEAKASVAVRLKRGVELSKSSIAGIRGLVAGAVPGLKTFNVSIVDDLGRLLSPAAGSADAGRSEVEAGIREQLEKEMTTKVVSILEPVVGKGKVHANASVEIDANSVEQTEETYQPNPPAVLSQQKTEERVGGVGLPSGVPGTQSNVAGQNNPQTRVSNGPDRTRQSETTNFELSKLVRHTVQPKGQIRRLSVAVILDHKTVYSKEKDGRVSERAEPRTQQELDSYRELVLATVGYDKERGDVVTLENVPFYSDSRPEEDGPAVPWYTRHQQFTLPAMKYVSFLLLFLFVYLILFRPIRNRVFHVAAPPASAGPEKAALTAAETSKAIAGAGLAEGGELPPAPEGATAASAAPMQIGDGSDSDVGQDEEFDFAVIDKKLERDFLKEAQMLDLGSRKYSVLKKRLVERAAKDPEAVAQLVRTWVAERN